MSQVKLPVLTQADIDLLKEIVGRERNRRGNTAQRPAQQHVPPMAPEVYMVFTPIEGVPPAHFYVDENGYWTLSLGSAECHVYRYNSNIDRLQRTAVTRVVKNFSCEYLFGNRFYLIERDKFGTWYFGTPGCNPPPEEFTGTSDLPCSLCDGIELCVWFPGLTSVPLEDSDPCSDLAEVLRNGVSLSSFFNAFSCSGVWSGENSGVISDDAAWNLCNQSEIAPTITYSSDPDGTFLLYIYSSDGNTSTTHATYEGDWSTWDCVSSLPLDLVSTLSPAILFDNWPAQIHILPHRCSDTGTSSPPPGSIQIIGLATTAGASVDQLTFNDLTVSTGMLVVIVAQRLAVPPAIGDASTLTFGGNPMDRQWWIESTPNMPTAFGGGDVVLSVWTLPVAGTIGDLVFTAVETNDEILLEIINVTGLAFNLVDLVQSDDPYYQGSTPNTTTNTLTTYADEAILGIFVATSLVGYTWGGGFTSGDQDLDDGLIMLVEGRQVVSAPAFFNAILSGDPVDWMGLILTLK